MAEQKTKLSEVEQQLKKAEAAQRRIIQSTKAAREAEAEAIRKICCLDYERKKEEKIKKRHDEVVQAKAAKMDRLDQILLDGSLVRLEQRLFSLMTLVCHAYLIQCRAVILHDVKNVQVQIVQMPRNIET
ncbi:uncharacterized protein LOC133697054 [Populus nigra]|uniref:uncharacterized protein LOC133697054 n=1 Tax=Populus nigra TaxID=3691 RepID=UPI002B276DF1|nr:uncharacterized protein LOC133697054 [Populus nigra]